MIKKIIILVMLSVIILMYVAKDFFHTTNIDNIDTIQSLTISSTQLAEYGNQFEILLNYINGYAENSQLDNIELIDKNLFEVFIDNDVPEKDNVNMEDNYNEEEDIDSKYIVNRFGFVIGEGNYDESELAYKNFDNARYYTILYTDILKDKIRFKVFNKGQQKAELYIAELDAKMKIISYKLVR